MEKELALIGVNKIYKLDNKETFHALHDINVEFDKGELVSIVGESGSGKSTLMNLIGGLDSDFTGKIIAGGEELGTLGEKELDKYRKNKVGFVFQSFNLISHLSILDNVTLALTLSNVGEKEKIKKATEMLKKVGLFNQLKKKPTQLSGGQKQRVAIARALINDPEIIIADEPTGALDSQTSMQILEILKEIADSGKLVIMVTHSEKVASISSRVVEISDGKIVSDHINKNYQKTEEPIEDDEPVLVIPKIVEVEKKKKRFGKEKQNLSLISAVRLSFHNMWASKVKNFLMAFGVAIGIGSLILMMSFSSGLTDYIDNTMKSYSNPEIVTVSKKSKSLGDALQYDKLKFKQNEEVDEIKELYDDINGFLQKEKIDFTVDETNTSFGFALMTMVLPEASVSDRNDNENKKSIYYLYSIPPYYSKSNVIDGEMSKPPVLNEDGTIKKENGIPVDGGGFMFTKGIYDLYKNPIGQKVKIELKLPDGTEFTFADQICGVMDTSVMSGFLVAYVDYDYLKALFENTAGAKGMFAPTTIYINTGDKSLTDKINDYLKSSTKYTGSLEDSLAGMFSSMSSTIGTSLTVISCISLVVSAMMILVVLYMSVSERTKEIGVLKSIGARRKDIKRIFTSESFLVGVLSGLIGILFNLVITLIVWLVLKFTLGFAPISYRWWYFFIAMGVSIIISMLSGLYPASKAAKLDPVESLRRE